MATKTHGSLAASAASYLERSGDVVPLSRGGASEIRSQSNQLYEWAQRNQCVLNYVPSPGTPRSQGAEHEVFFDEAAGRVFKKTKQGSFGSLKTSVGIRKTATPYFYLRRLEWTNEVFGSDLRFEGVIKSGYISALISQPWSYPADPKHPLPSDIEVIDFMTSMEFKGVRNTYHEWFRKSDCFHVCDARPDNFIKTKQGVIPIDLIVSNNPDFDPTAH